MNFRTASYENFQEQFSAREQTEDEFDEVRLHSWILALVKTINNNNEVVVC